MGDPLSITASIIAILQAASVTVSCLHAVRHSGKDIKDLINELGSLQGILTSLRDYAGANPDSTTLQTLDTPLRECLGDMKILQAKLEPKGSIRKGMLRLGWVLKDKECSQYLGKVERLKTSISLAMDLDRESRSKAIAIQVKRGMEGEKRTKVFNWLNPTAYDERHLEISNRRQRNTGGWLLKEEVVVDWVRGNSASRILLGYGIPGAGKTFLGSLMIDDLCSRAAAENWGVAFMYFNHSEQNQQTPIFFLSSIVKQFACQIVDLPEQLNELYDQLQPQEKRPTLEQLYSLLLAVSQLFTQVFIIGDALDECDQQAQRRELLPLFNRMGEDGMRLFLTSRPYPEDIQHALELATRIELSAKDEDITVYIERKIAENRRAESLVKQAKCKGKIVSMLQTCANGMFLLVHFHIRYLCQQTTPRQLLDALEMLEGSSGREFESPMDPTYNRAMQTIQSQHKSCVKLAVNILTWLVKSQRVLTVRELQQAVSVEQHQTMFDELTLPSEKTMVDVCASLVSIDHESNTVRLVHYTVEEYLVNNPIITRDAEFRIVMACATFLSYGDFSGGACTTEEAPLDARLEMHPFLDYAGKHFGYHLRQCDETLSFDLVLKLLKNTQNIMSYIQVTGINIVRGLPLDEMFDGIGLALAMAAGLEHTAAMRALLKEGKDNSCFYKVEYTEELLMIAVKLGINPMIELLLENGAEINAEMLCNAAGYQHASTVRLLIDKGAAVSATDSGGETLLHIAVGLRGDEEVLRTLLEKGADISATDKNGQSPLHTAASYGDVEAVRTLLEKGADISATDKDGRSPLHTAVSDGSVETVRTLLEKGADISATDKDGRSPLHTAVSDGSVETVRTLLEKGADISATDKDGRSPLHTAVFYWRVETIRTLLEISTGISATDKDGRSPLHTPASDGSIETVRTLLEKGADISATDKDGRSPLHTAAYYWHVEAVRTLLEKGADISATDKNGQSPLHTAASGGSVETVRTLLEKGADILATDKDGQSPLHTAAAPLYGVLAVRTLLEKGADISATDKNGQSTLHTAASGGSVETVRTLLEKGADISATDKDGRSPLHTAAFNNRVEAVRILVEKGADVSVMDKEGRTPLDFAASQNSVEVVETLVEKDADVSVTDKEGRTLLHVAATSDLGRKTVRALLEKGAGILATDNAEMTQPYMM